MIGRTGKTRLTAEDRHDCWMAALLHVVETLSSVPKVAVRDFQLVLRNEIEVEVKVYSCGANFWS